MTDSLQGVSLSQDRRRREWLEGPHEAFRARARHDLFMSMSIFCFHNQPINGYYFEFGCHKARTMRLAWDTFHSLYDWTFVAFDSFEGLPEMDPADSMPIWKKGDLKTCEADFVNLVTQHGMPRERLKIVKGFYADSLTPALRDELLPQKAAVVYIDCDLYSSTVTALDFSRDFFQTGTILVFDDWFCFYGDPTKGERRAFAEFRERNPDLIFENYIQTNEAKCFICLDRKTSSGEIGHANANGK